MGGSKGRDGEDGEKEEKGRGKPTQFYMVSNSLKKFVSKNEL